METAQQVINDALQEILVQASEQSVQSVDFQTGRRYLNRMMTALDAQGISLGYTNIILPTDLVTVPDGALEAIVFNLALKLVNTYDIPAGPMLAFNAREGMKVLRVLGVTMTPTSLPCTLPCGSGNDKFYSDTYFYPCPADEVLEEQGGSILLESNTNEAT
jgi:hypothetical protein